MVETRLQGWLRHKNHADPRIRKRFAVECAGLGTQLAAAVWAMRRWYRKDGRMHSRLDALLQKLYGEFGLKTRATAPVLGAFLLHCIRRENARLNRGWTYEPASAYEKNSRLRMMEKERSENCAAPAPAVGAQEALLGMQTRTAEGACNPLVFDLQGVFNAVNALRLKDRVESLLKRDVDVRVLALNFREVTAIDREALLEFLEKLRGYKDRIKIVSIETFREELADVVKLCADLFRRVCR